MTSSQVDRWIDVFKIDEADLAAQVEKMAKAMEADDAEIDEVAPKSIEQADAQVTPESGSANKSKTLRTKDPSKTRHRASTIDIHDVAANAPIPQAAIPDDLIAQAEQMLNDTNPPKAPIRRKPT